MADDMRGQGARDRSRIDVHQPEEVRHWTKELKISEERLKEIVARVGVSANQVREAVRTRS
jgi:hypothetical protein